MYMGGPPSQQLFSLFVFRAGRPVVSEPAHTASRPSVRSAVESFSGGRGGRLFKEAPSKLPFPSDFSWEAQA